MIVDSYVLYKEKLQGEYFDVFCQVESYVQSQLIEDDTMEEHMGELLDLFLAAQEDGKPVTKITGKNIEYFCKSFCADFTWKNKLLNILDAVKWLVWSIFLFSTLDAFLYAWDNMNGYIQVDFWTQPSALTVCLPYVIPIGIFVLIGEISGFIKRKIMFRIRKTSVKIWNVITFLIQCIVYFIVFDMLKDNAAEPPAWITALVSGVYLLFYYILNHKRLAERKKQKITFGAMVQKEIDKTFDQDMLKIYEKKNKRRMKRGKPLLSWETFLDEQEKSYLREEKYKWIYSIFPVLCVIGFGLYEVIVGGMFESFMDFVFFSILIFVVEFFIMYFTWKMQQPMIESTRKWVEEERRKLAQMPEDMEDKER